MPIGLLLIVFLCLTLAPPVGAQSLNANDASKEPPRLMLVQAMWGMIGLPSKDKEWPLEEKVRLIKEAGFDAADQFDKGTPEATPQEKGLIEAFDKYGLRAGYHTVINSLDEFPAAIATAKRRKSLYVDVHVGNYFTPENEAMNLLSAMADEAKRAHLAMMVQTHRGRVTQDLHRTIAYAEAIPDLRFCLDLSHYFVAGEIGGQLSPQAEQAFDVLLKRASMLDGRVSNGEQVQIDIGADGDTAHAKYFAQLWKRAMVNWLRSAKPGDLFVFRVELGPPGYSILEMDGKEMSNRWEQAKVFRALAERIWNEAVAETGIGVRHSAKTTASKL